MIMSKGNCRGSSPQKRAQNDSTRTRRHPERFPVILRAAKGPRFFHTAPTRPRYTRVSVELEDTWDIIADLD
jgi:hypothetical protein